MGWSGWCHDAKTKPHYMWCPALPAPPSHTTSAAPHRNRMTLYHITSQEVAKLIVAGQFKPGHGGWCGGATYLMAYPHLPRSKWNPETTQDGAVVEVQVDLGKMCSITKPAGCKDGSSGKCCPVEGGGFGFSAVQRNGCDSILFKNSDGDEYVIWPPYSQIVSKTICCEGEAQCYERCLRQWSRQQCQS